MTKMARVNLTEGKVLSVLLALAIPVMGSSTLQLTYNLVDMLLVGKLGSDAVASIGTSSFLIGIMNALNACIVVGTGIKVSHTLGSNHELELKSYLNAGFRMNLGLAFLCSLLLILLGKPFITFLEISNPVVEKSSYQYLLVCAPMIVFSFLNFWYTRIYNSYGQNKSALKISAVGVLLNLILDPILIYGFKLGVVGTGLATTIANLSMTLLFYYHSKALFHLDWRLKVNRKHYRTIARLGVPMSSQRIIFTLVSIGLAKMIATFGTEAIAAQKIGLQIESITYMVVGGLNGAIASFVGQNYGAYQYERIRQGFKASLLVGGSYAIVTTFVFLLFPANLSALFVQDAKTIEITANYLKIVGVTQIFMVIEMICNGMFVGLGIPKIPATISIVFTVLRLPMAWILIQVIGVNGIWLSISLSMLFKGVMALIAYIKKYREGEWCVSST